MNRIWVVERLNEKTRKYELTVADALDRQTGRDLLSGCRKHNPFDTFRLVQYVEKK